MTYDPERHHRRSIRLPGYDYAQPGAYFVTICTHDGEPLFGDVIDGIMQLNRFGRIVQACWYDLPRHYPHVMLDAFVVMPNHVHMLIILILTGNAAARETGARLSLTHAESDLEENPFASTYQPAADGLVPSMPDDRPASKTAVRHALPEIVRALKTFSARRINDLRHTSGLSVWQRNYYEHVVRDQADLDRIRRYIAENPQRWALDEDNPTRGDIPRPS